MIKERTAKKRILIFAAIFISLVAIDSFAGANRDGWVNPAYYPTPDDLIDVKFITPMKGWIVERGWSLFYTEDGGDTWKEQESLTEKYFTGVSFVNDKLGWSAEGKSISRTQDGGETWQSQYTEQVGIAKVFFINEREGWAVRTLNTEELIHTYDGGKTWDQPRTGINRSISSIYFVNPEFGWALAGEEVYRTVDGGKRWEAARLPIGQLPGHRVRNNLYMDFRGGGFKEPENSLGFDWRQGDIAFANEKQGWAVVFHWVFHSNDGGKTWFTQLDTGNSSYSLNRISFRDELNGCVSGWTIFCTEDGGKTWQERLGLTPTETQLLEGISLTGQSEGWAVGGSGRILRTEDKGRSWKSLLKSDKCGNQLLVISDKTRLSWSVWSKSICRSDDGGNTWIKQNVGIKVKDLFFADDLTGWAVGNIEECKDGKEDCGSYNRLNSWGVIKYTSDGGKTWETQFKESFGKDGFRGLTQVVFVNRVVGWTIGEKGTILHTDDGGKHWNRQRSGTGLHLRKVHFSDKETGVAIGDRGVALGEDSAEDKKAKGIILYTNDAGQHWSIVWEDKPVLMTGLFYLDRNTAWATVERVGHNALLYTENGGKSWTEKPLENTATFSPYSPYFLDKNRGVIFLDYNEPGVFRNPMLLLTFNGGKTWTRMKMPLKKDPWHVSELFKKP